mgnify:CR=1 FL=1
MDGLIDIASARTLVAAPLWPRIRDFLWNFPSQIHPSWFDRLTVGPLDRFLPPPDSRPSGQPAPRLPSRIARWLCTELSVEPCFHANPVIFKFLTEVQHGNTACHAGRQEPGSLRNKGHAALAPLSLIGPGKKQLYVGA